MENKNKTKIIVDRIVFFAMVATAISTAIWYIHKMITGKPSIHFITSLLAILVISFVALFITAKKYGPYREDGESTLPLWVIFINILAFEHLNGLVMDTVNTISKTATNHTKGSVQIISILAVWFIVLIVYIKAIAYLEKKYNQYKKAKREQE